MRGDNDVTGVDAAFVVVDVVICRGDSFRGAINGDACRGDIDEFDIFFVGEVSAATSDD